MGGNSEFRQELGVQSSETPDLSGFGAQVADHRTMAVFRVEGA